MDRKKEEFTGCMREWEKLLEDAADGIYVSDLQTYELLYANDFVKRIFCGAGERDYKGRKCYEYLLGYEKPCEFCKMNQMKEDEYLFREFQLPGRDAHFVLKGRKAEWNGRTAHVEYIYDNTLQIHKRDELIERYEREILETSEKKEKLVENALGVAQRANDAKNELLTRVSREMKRPVRTLEEELQCLLGEVPEENRDAVSNIILKTQRLRRMIDNMVDLSEFSQGILSFENNDIHMASLLDSIYHALKPVAQEKEIVLDFSYELHGLERVCEDEYRLRQVFMNLVSNAITFSERGKKVFCKVSMDEYQGDKALMKVVISDEGIGMEETFMRRAFSPFEKEGRKNAAEGIGLGLSVATHIIEQKEGRIWMESKPYEGTKVSFVVPMQISESCIRRENKESFAMRRGRANEEFSHLRALVVAEDEVVRQTADIRLQKLGLVAENAVNRQQAVNMVAESEEGYYDILVVQMEMPLKASILTLREIHMLDRIDVHEMPVVAMNMDPFMEDMQNAGEAEIDYQWGKPYKTEELRKILYKEFYPGKYREIYEKKGFRVVK